MLIMLPYDKSWFIRIAFLKFIKDGTYPSIPPGSNDDMKSFVGALRGWDEGKTIDVGECLRG